MQVLSVSIIIPTYNGLEHLIECLASLTQITYPRQRIQTIVVDDGSSDGTSKQIRKRFRDIRIIRNRNRLGFTSSIAEGVRASNGRVLVFLNNDTRVEPNWLKELVRPLSTSGRVVCSCSNILNWDGSRTELAGRDIDAFGLELGGKEATSLGTVDRPVLFASGGSMAIFKAVFLRVSGFDRTFGMYHEDVDLGWRLWLLGYKVRYCKGSIIYHRGGSTARALNHSHQEALRISKIRNLLYTVIKNSDADNLTQLLPAILSYIRHQSLRRMEFQALAQATVEVVLNLRNFLSKRKRIQSRRIRSDSEIFARTGHPFQFLLNSDYMSKRSSQIREKEGDGVGHAPIRQLLFDSLIAQVTLTRHLIDEHNELATIQASLGYRCMRFYASKIDRLFPDGTKRGEFRQWLTNRVAS